MTDRVRVDIDNRIARVTLSRPGKHNAVDGAMFESIIAAGELLAGNDSIRAVILSGAGENFCAGIDTSVFTAGDRPLLNAADMQPRAGSNANFYQSAAMVWRLVPVPVIAAVQGVAFGAGLQIALGADLRIASPESRWSVMEIKWGIVPDMGITVTARHLIAPDRLKRLAMTGQIIDGKEAFRLGLITELHDCPLEAADTLAREIAGRSPNAVRAIKKLIDESWGGSPDAALQREAMEQGRLIGAPNQIEAVMANLHKRAPDFSDVDAADNAKRG
jgi:enoyl-CoA hydratase/carnithine racemase